MIGWLSRRGQRVREMLLLELQRTSNGLSKELRSMLARRGLEVSRRVIESQLRVLAGSGLVERNTYVEITAAGYRAAAEIGRKKRVGRDVDRPQDGTPRQDR
jgi:repressor of nif and glnA expression